MTQRAAAPVRRPIRAQGVVITRILEDWDMRFVHAGLREYYMDKLRPGEVVLALNSSRTMTRIIDSQGNVLSSYAPAGEEFDIDTLREYLFAGLAINIEVSPKAMPKAKAIKKAA